MTSINELAEDLAEIFEHTGWRWGLELAGIPEHVPDAQDIAEKIEELLEQMVEPGTSPARQRILSGGRIVLAVGNPPPYDQHVRVFVDVGELPLPRRDIGDPERA